MTGMVIQTPLWFFFVLIGVAFVLGAGIVFTVSSRRIRRSAVGASDNEALYLIVSRLSHRLKTVGEVIRGHLHGFTDHLPTDAERWRVSRRSIGEEAAEIGSLSQRLDLMVRLGMSGQPLVMEAVNVPALIEDIMIDLAPAADDKGLVPGGVVRSENGTSVPHPSGDEAALREVFSNLIENAIKHNNAGVQVIADVKTAGRRMEISISDTGSGIAPELLSTMFARGNRHYTRGEVRGTGMGMYLCKLLVEPHGGTLSAESKQGQGTIFTISLPMRGSGSWDREGSVRMPDYSGVDLNSNKEAVQCFTYRGTSGS